MTKKLLKKALKVKSEKKGPPKSRPRKPVKKAVSGPRFSAKELHGFKSIMKAMVALFGMYYKFGKMFPSYDYTLEVARTVNPDTKFQKSHYYWYRMHLKKLGVVGQDAHSA
uniref:Uncharacterized protein n=1 Tax=viral metagenome TaxID=1070528 RepID=A0A6H2A4E2_9ZZZZ